MSDDEAHPLSRGLLVEPIDDARKKLLEMLKGTEYEIRHSAATLEEACRTLQQGTTVDFILTEYQLPDGNGAGVVRRLRSAAQSAPIVVLTDGPDEQASDHTMEAGGQDVIAKGDLSPALLTKAIAFSLERKRHEEALLEMTLRDPLTALGNRKSFTQHFSKLRDGGGHFALLLIDVAGLKRINERFGHGAGDNVLRDTGVLLSECLRMPDHAARLGGDGFGLWLDGINDRDTLVRIMGRVKALLDVTVPGHDHPIEFHLGGAVFPGDGTSVDGLLEAAENDLNEHTKKPRARAASNAGGPSAWAGAESALVLVYQPIVDLRTHRTVRWEALARLRRFRGELLAPGAFLSELGRAGRFRLDQAVLETALQEREVWMREVGTPFRLSINACPTELEFLHWSEQFLEFCRTAQVPPGVVQVELTESAAIRDWVLARTHLDKLRSEGIRVALDDFGSGHANMEALQELPIDTLKIDRALVQHLKDRQASRRLVENAVHLANSLDLECVAEGVEDPEQAKLLTDLGCFFGQGFWLGRPKQLSEIIAAEVADTTHAEQAG